MDLPWSNGWRRYAGWIPNVRTHLSFSMIGAARDADTVSLPIGRRKRVVAMLQRRMVNDFPLPAWLATRRVPGIVTDWLLDAETAPTLLPCVQGDRVVGERDRQGMLRGRIYYLPLSIGLQLTSQRDVAPLSSTIRAVIALQRRARETGDEADQDALARSLAGLRDRVGTLAAASGEYVAVEIALMRTGECRIWYPAPVEGRSTGELDVVARHAYYFVKDAVHSHTHHDPTSDQITPLVRDDSEDDPDEDLSPVTRTRRRGGARPSGVCRARSNGSTGTEG